MPTTTPSVAICLPAQGAAVRSHERSLLALCVAERSWIPLDVPGCSYLDAARSILAEAAIAEGVDVALFLDSDITFKPEAVVALVTEAHAREAVVGGLYVDKAFGGRLKTNFLAGTTEVKCYEGGSVLEVLDIGCGAMAIPTRVLLGMSTRLGMQRMRIDGPGESTMCFPWFFTALDGATFRSEDYAFTKRVRAAGYKVFADTRQRFGHVGEHEFMLEDTRFTVPRFTTAVFRNG